MCELTQSSFLAFKEGSHLCARSSGTVRICAAHSPTASSGQLDGQLSARDSMQLQVQISSITRLVRYFEWAIAEAGRHLPHQQD
jgi:hypothetical protein